jgi:hypothetical protein
MPILNFKKQIQWVLNPKGYKKVTMNIKTGKLFDGIPAYLNFRNEI